ncbi:hypothetical protein TDMWS_12270 [Thermodesulfomicrobium sp. WS]|uniref:PilZ domain-containing protein n=1 Tax=Thermodesulfomicrobium sp. WS TaxID=3004129 RepID=UPI002493937D|nr:PilZ domain-containing protein [Thermodesulfomicrobium sp. WS]BDV01142.1 hypothetical protein TDMWS_12270 [Thermodesulfomicrobium sp. WS]
MHEQDVVESLVRVDGTEGDELLFWAEEEPVDAVRSTYRVPLDAQEAWLRLGEQSWPVLDISRWGLGIALEDGALLEPGMVLEGARLEVDGRTLAVDVEVVHVSADVGEHLRCGLAVVRAAEEFGSFVEEFVTRRKARIVGEAHA